MKPVFLKISFSFFLIQFLFGSLHAQMVNIESMRMQTDSVRVAGNGAFSFSYQENNSISLLMLKTSLALQLKSKSLKDIFMVIGNADISKSEDSDLSNAAFMHVRYNRKFSKFFRWEVFSQIQYNKLLNVGLRLLNGTGPRLKWLNKENFAGYFGSLYMFEYEETSGIMPEINRHHRLSNYLTLSLSFPKIKGEFVSTTYFQPRLDKFDDFRLMQQTSLLFNITSKIKLTTGFSFLFDAFPPANVTQRAMSFEQGIRIDF